MAMRLSALFAVHTLARGRYLVLISEQLNLRAIVLLVGLGKLKTNSITSSEIEPATFLFLA
jgi:hypothetical protein